MKRLKILSFFKSKSIIQKPKNMKLIVITMSHRAALQVEQAVQNVSYDFSFKLGEVKFLEDTAEVSLIPSPNFDAKDLFWLGIFSLRVTVTGCDFNVKNCIPNEKLKYFIEKRNAKKESVK